MPSSRTSRTSEHDDRPPRYIEDDKIVYRASGLMLCPKIFVAYACGEIPRPHPEWFQEVLDEGTRSEPVIRQIHEAMSDTGTMMEQHEVELLIGEIDGQEIIVRGHIDGVSKNTLDGYVLREFKKFRDDPLPSGGQTQWSRFLQQGIEINPNYPWQISVYMHGLETSYCEFVGGRFVDGEIIGAHVKQIAMIPIPFKAIRKHVMQIERTIRAGFAPLEIQCEKKTYPCPFFYLHEWDENEAYKLPEDSELSDLIREYGHEFNAICVEQKALEVRRQYYIEGLKETIAALGEDAIAAKFIDIGDGRVLRHARETVKEHTRKETTREYFQVRDEK